ncbi:MAG: glycosyltransferase [Actinomycetia bacterium]|nr:glycosyltransferase [Actinomycetes bacterium]
MFARSKMPLVTIVTPSLNQGGFIRGAIESVLQQTYPNIEYIVMDAGSTDETKAVAAQYADRLVFVSEPDRGQSHAINKGWKLGKGEILAWLCADDILLPGAVQTIVDTFTNHPEASVAFGGCEMLDLQGRTVGTLLASTPNMWKLTHGYDYVAQPAAFVARRAIEAVGFVDESLHFGMDWDLFMRLMALGPFVPIPEVLARAHTYSETKSLSGGFRRWRELVVIMRRHGDRRYPPGYFIYGVDSIRSSCRRWLRRAPRWVSRLSRIPKQWVSSSIDLVYRSAMTKATGGWFDDTWAGPTVMRRLSGNGQTLTLCGRVPSEYPDLVDQRLKVSCDGKVVARRDVAPGSFSWELPLPLRVDGDVEVKICARRSFVPKRRGLSADGRRLAFYLDELTVA